MQAIVPERSVDEMIQVLDAVPPGSDAILERRASRRAARRGVRPDHAPHREQLPAVPQVLLTDLPHTVAFIGAALLDTAGRLSLLARRGPAVVVFEPGEEPGAVDSSAAAADAGEGLEVIKLKGQASGSEWPAGMRVTYQARFLRGFLRAVRSSVVRYSVADPTRQWQWTVSSSPYLYVVMPWRAEETSMARTV